MQGERQVNNQKSYSRSRGPRQEERKINTDQVISYLSHAFARAAQKASYQIGNRNHKGTCLYHYQTEFCYLVNEIQRGPEYILPKVIQDANQLIFALENETHTHLIDKKY